MVKIIKNASLIALGALLLIPVLTNAQQIPKSNGGIPLISPDPQFNISLFVANVLSWAFGLLIVIAVLFVLYAAFLYLTAGGDEEKIKQAKNYIIYAVVALVVGAISQALIAIVNNFLQTQ